VRLLLEKETIIMKRKIYIFSALIILLSATFGYAQPKLITREELDKRQVKKFVDKFMKSLDETKDLNSTLSKFASKNLKTNLEKFDLDYENQLKELSPDEQFEHKILMLNLAYLGFRNAFVNEIKRELNNDETKSDTEEMFPPEVLEILKRNPLISKSFELKEDKKTDDDEDSDKEEIEKPITSLDIAETTEIMRNALAAFKIFIDSREPSAEEISALNTAISSESSYDSLLCKDTDCFGLPEKTRIFWNSVYPLCLHLVRENGELKVFYIDINIGD
jgi:hypothetical protein